VAKDGDLSEEKKREFPAKVVKYQDLNNRTIKVSFLICTFARLCDAVNKMAPVD
jgi:hypothetical protein